jgi:hypothetical protein
MAAKSSVAKYASEDDRELIPTGTNHFLASGYRPFGAGLTDGEEESARRYGHRWNYGWFCDRRGDPFLRVGVWTALR